MSTNIDINTLGSTASQYSLKGAPASNNTATFGSNMPTTNPAVGYSGVQMAMLVLLMIGQEATSLSQQVNLLSSHQKETNQGLLQFAQTEKSSSQNLTAFSPIEFNDEISLAETALTSNAMSMSTQDATAKGEANNERGTYLFGKGAISIYTSIAQTQV